jgi:predicted RNA-binding protein associated with RNAse of E/G family
MHGLDLELACDGSPSLIDGDAIRLSLNDELIAVGRFDATQSVIHPAVVLVTE